MQKILLIFFILFTVTLTAQESVTLESAINYALEHSPALNIEKIKVKDADLKLKDSHLLRIPEIYLSGNIRRNLIIQATPVPANIFDSSRPEDEIMYLQFNTKWNSSAGINLNYDLFNPEKVNKISQEKQQLKIQEFDQQISVEKLREKISLVYAECVIAEEQKQLLIKDTTYYASLLNDANHLYLNEKIMLIEKNDAHRTFNESMTGYLEAEKIVKERKAELLYLLGREVTLENIESLLLQESIPELLKKMEENTFHATALNSLMEMRQLEIIDLTRLNIKNALMKYAPTLTINGFYGTNYYKNDLSLFNKRYWRGNSFIGLSISIPVTQSFRTSNEVTRLRLQRQMEVENMRDIHNSNEKERINKFSDLLVRKKSYHLCRENWELSQQNSEAAKVKFAKGYILQTELLNEQLKMQQTRQSFLQAAYDLFCSMISLNKTIKK